MLVKELLDLSPLRLVTASPNLSVSEVASRMARFQIGFVVVMDHDDAIVGVLSERDIVSAYGDEDVNLDDAVVGDLMTESVVTVSPDDSLVDAVLSMNSHGIRHLVAAEGGKPVGVLSIRDLLRVLARQLLESETDGDGQFTMDFVKALAA
jgi:CBS domain-containing protein